MHSLLSWVNSILNSFCELLWEIFLEIYSHRHPLRRCCSTIFIFVVKVINKSLWSKATTGASKVADCTGRLWEINPMHVTSTAQTTSYFVIILYNFCTVNITANSNLFRFQWRRQPLMVLARQLYLWGPSCKTQANNQWHAYLLDDMPV